MYPYSSAPQPERGRGGLWTALIVVIALTIVCVCVAGVALLLFLPSSPVRLPVDGFFTATPAPVAMPPLTPPTATVPPPTSLPDAPTPETAAGSGVPDLSGVVSAAFTFSRRGGTLHTIPSARLHDVHVHLLAAVANASYLEAHGFGLERFL